MIVHPLRMSVIWGREREYQSASAKISRDGPSAIRSMQGTPMCVSNQLPSDRFPGIVPEGVACSPRGPLGDDFIPGLAAVRAGEARSTKWARSEMMLNYLSTGRQLL
jgi:hypothetical protein